MLRENPGYEISGEGEFQTLCRIVGEFAEVGVRGLVLGFLAALSTSRQPGAFYTRRPVQKTFHRAFEEVPDQAAVLAALKTLAQFDRILTSGARGSLLQLTRIAGPEIRTSQVAA
jgi:copper homeostasis protein CutC